METRIRTPFHGARSLWVAALATAMAWGLVPASAAAQTKVLVNPGDQSGQARFAIYSEWKVALEQALQRLDRQSGSAVMLSSDTTADLSAIRSRIPEVVVGPAHIVGSALRYGYQPVLGVVRPQQAVVVVPRDSRARKLEDLKGQRLGLPQQDSLVTYLVRGETNAANTTLKRHFSELYQTRWQDALLMCIKLMRCDAVAVERGLYEQWVAAGEPVRTVLETRAVPAISVALRTDSRIAPDALAAALSDSLARVSAENPRPALATLARNDFSYVSTLGYFTPRSLAGATVVEPDRVAQLMEKGARYIDTRNKAEFDEGHVPGAVLVPYGEKSAKDADFAAADDSFDVAQLGPDKQRPLIFGCNGAECWKSFKASVVAIKAGYTNVYWFRGGYPAWRQARTATHAAPPA